MAETRVPRGVNRRAVLIPFGERGSPGCQNDRYILIRIDDNSDTSRTGTSIGKPADSDPPILASLRSPSVVGYACAFVSGGELLSLR